MAQAALFSGKQQCLARVNALLSAVFLVLAFSTYTHSQPAFLADDPGSDYAYSLRLRIGKAFFTKTGVVFNLSDFDHHHSKKGKPAWDKFALQWVGTKGSDRWVASGKSETVYNFLKGMDSKHWRRGLHAYASVTQKDVYKGIDANWFEEGQTLCYNLKGSAKADWAAAGIKLIGGDMTLKGGSLFCKTNLGCIEIAAPKAWTIKAGKRDTLACRYVLKNGVAQFALGSFKNSDSVLIDPRLVFSTYSGSSADNWGTSATYDTLGNVYSAGMVFDYGFPTTRNAYQAGYANGNSTNDFSTDMGILKFSPDGRRLLYATYLGGNGQDVPQSLIADDAGNLLIMGTTSSNDLATTAGAAQRGFGGGNVRADPFGENFMYFYGADLYIAKLSASGSDLLAATYLGGSGLEGLNPFISGPDLMYVANYGDQFRGEIGLDRSGNVYIASSTTSNDLHTVSAIQNTYQGERDGLVARFTPTLALSFCTYLGGRGGDCLNGLALATNGDILVCGGTASTNLPATQGAYQTSNGFSGSTFSKLDGFCARLRPGSLSSLTYFGGSSYDQAFFVREAPDGSIYILGQTSSTLPHTNRAVGSANGTQFVGHFNAELSQLLDCTRFGTGASTSADITPTAFQVDVCGQVYVAGWGGSVGNNSVYIETATTGLSVTADAAQRTTDGQDFYICVFNSGMSGLKYATFMGADGGVTDHVDGGTSRFDPKGHIYEAACAGCGGSSLFPTTPGVYSRTNNSNNCNNAVFKFDLTPLAAPLRASLAPTSLCERTPITLTHNGRSSNNFYVNFGDGQSSTTYAQPITHSYADSGHYRIYLRADGGDCAFLDSLSLNVQVLEGVHGLRDTSYLFCIGDTLQLQPAFLRQPGASYTWAPPKFLSSDTAFSPIAIPLYNIDYTISGLNLLTGCTTQAQVAVHGKPIPLNPTIQTRVDSCKGTVVAQGLVAAGTLQPIWHYNGQETPGPNFRYFTETQTNSDLIVNANDGVCYGSYHAPLNLVPSKVVFNSQYQITPRFVSCNALAYDVSVPLDADEEISWYAGNAFLNNGSPLAYTPVDTGMQNVKRVYYKSGCVDTLDIQFKAQQPFVSNIITSNGDSKNDCFELHNITLPIRLDVYNRWGGAVYGDKNYSGGFCGGELPEGTYFYYIQAPEGGSCKGWFEVITDRK